MQDLSGDLTRDLLLRPLLFVALAALFFMPLERVFGHSDQQRPDLQTDLWFATIGQLLHRAGLVLGLGALLALVDPLGLDQPLWGQIENRPLRIALEIMSGLLVFELIGYLMHRLGHAIPLLWRLHRVHHSAQHLDWLTGFRQHPLEALLWATVQNVPLVLLGLPLGTHAGILLLLKLNTAFVHSNLPSYSVRFQLLLATPHFHHRHHALHGKPANFATLWPWVDRIFGTFCPHAAAEFGVAEPVPRGFVGLLLWPLRQRSGQRGDAGKLVVGEMEKEFALRL